MAQAEDSLPKGFDEYIAQAVRDWKVPGLAIAVVKGDAVGFAKGYGVRKLGESAPVDERTLFAIGSCSKAFTATALAWVSEGWAYAKQILMFPQGVSEVGTERRVPTLRRSRGGSPRRV